MKVLKREHIRPFDVDGCLIVDTAQGEYNVNVFDAVTKQYIKVGVNTNMVRLLKEERQRGSYIVVWSRSGWEWAANVIKALYLESCVDRVMSKPIVYFDDTPVEEWLKDRVFIGPEVKYKR
jgi:hypothetical protein